MKPMRSKLPAVLSTAALALAAVAFACDARAQGGGSYGQDGTGSSYTGQGAGVFGGSGFNVPSGATSSGWNAGSGGWNAGGEGRGASTFGRSRPYWEPQARSSYWELSTYNRGGYSGPGGQASAGGSGFNAGPPPTPTSAAPSMFGAATIQPASASLQINPAYPRAGSGAYMTGSLYPLADSPYSLYPQAGATSSLYPQAGATSSLYPQANPPYAPAGSPYFQTNSPFSQVGQAGATEFGVAFPQFGPGGGLLSGVGTSGTGTPPPEIEPPPFTAGAASRNAGAALLQLNAEADLRNTRAAQLNGLYP